MSPNEQVEIVELLALPQAAPNSPMPIVMSDEHTALLAYLIAVEPEDAATAGPRVALVQFARYHTFAFGPALPETRAQLMTGAALRLPATYEVRRSTWIARLRRDDGENDRTPERYGRLRHLLFAFDCCTFEGLSEDFTVSVHDGMLGSVVSEMAERLGLAAQPV